MPQKSHTRGRFLEAGLLVQSSRVVEVPLETVFCRLKQPFVVVLGIDLNMPETQTSKERATLQNVKEALVNISMMLQLVVHQPDK